MDLGSKIKEFGLSKFKTLGEFADALGVKKESLSRYINNKVEPKAGLFIKLAEQGCNLTEMLTDAGGDTFRIHEKTEEYSPGKNLENTELEEYKNKEFQSALALVDKLIATNQTILEENKVLLNENMNLVRDYISQSKIMNELNQKTLLMLEKVNDILSENVGK